MSGQFRPYRWPSCLCSRPGAIPRWGPTSIDDAILRRGNPLKYVCLGNKLLRSASDAPTKANLDKKAAASG